MINLYYRIKLYFLKDKLNKDILFRFLMNTASSTQSAASQREPGMKMMIFAFYSKDFDKFLKEMGVNIGNKERERLRLINLFLKKHYKSNRIWIREEDKKGLNNYYFYDL